MFKVDSVKKLLGDDFSESFGGYHLLVLAWYRSIFGVIVLGTAYSGMVSWSAA